MLSMDFKFVNMQVDQQLYDVVEENVVECFNSVRKYLDFQEVVIVGGRGFKTEISFGINQPINMQNVYVDYLWHSKMYDTTSDIDISNLLNLKEAIAYAVSKCLRLKQWCITITFIEDTHIFNITDVITGVVQ